MGLATRPKLTLHYLGMRISSLVLVYALVHRLMQLPKLLPTRFFSPDRYGHTLPVHEDVIPVDAGRTGSDRRYRLGKVKRMRESKREEGRQTDKTSCGNSCVNTYCANRTHAGPSQAM